MGLPIGWAKQRRRWLAIEPLETRTLLAGNTTDGPGPDLIYDPATGNVFIGGDTTGTGVSGIDLQSCQSKFHPPTSADPFATFLANTPNQISMGTVNGPVSLADEFALGAIFPRGIPDVAALSRFLTAAAYGGTVRPTDFDLVIRESNRVLLRDSFDDDKLALPPAGPEVGSYANLSDGHFVVLTSEMCSPDSATDLGLASRTSEDRSNVLEYRPIAPTSRFEVSYALTHNLRDPIFSDIVTSPRAQAAARDEALIAQEFILEPQGTGMSLFWLDSGRLTLSFSVPGMDEEQEIDLSSTFNWQPNEPYQVLFSVDADAGLLSLSINDRPVFTSNALPIQFDRLTGLRFVDSTPPKSSEVGIDSVLLDDVTIIGQAADESDEANPFLLYGTTTAEFGSPGLSDAFVVLDSTNGSQMRVGAEGNAAGVASIDWDPVQGSMFGVDPDTPGVIGRVDLDTGITVPVATILQQGRPVTLSYLSFAADGTPWAAVPDQGIGTIDLAAATFTPTLEAPRGEDIQGIEISPDGILFVAHADLPNGAHTLTSIDLAANELLGEQRLGPNANELDFAPDGFLYHTNDSPGLFRLDPATGVQTLVGVGQLSALAGVASAPAEDAPARIDLELSGDVSSTEIGPGEEVLFTLTLTNHEDNANVPATGVQVRELPGNGLSLVDAVPSGNGTFADGIWSLVDPLLPGSSQSLTVTVRVNDGVVGGRTLVNIGEVIAANEIDHDSEPNNGGAQEDDSVLLSTTLESRIDLELDAQVSVAEAFPGEELTYTVMVRNNAASANSPATGVRIQNLLGNGLALVTATATGSGTFEDGVWTLVDPLSPGESQSLSIVARVVEGFPGGRDLVNFAQVLAAGTPDADSTPNNNDPEEDDQAVSIAATGSQIDLELAKQIDSEQVRGGEQVTWTLTLTNAPDANSAASGVRVQAKLPQDVALTQAVAENGSYEDAIWSLADPLAPGASTTLLIIGTVDANVAGGSALVSTAQVVAADQSDVDSQPDNAAPNQDEDDNASSQIDVEKIIDLELSKEVDPVRAAPGDLVTWVVAIANDSAGGNAPATAIQVTDVLPSGVTLSMVAPTIGTYENSIWTIDELPLGTTEALVLRVRIDDDVAAGDQITNVAEITAAAEIDFDSTPANGNASEDDQASATIGIDLIDLELSTTVDDPTPVVGQTVAFSLSLVNNDDNANVAATSVAVTNLLPDGLAFVSADTLNGAYDEATGIWMLTEALPAGATATLSIEATVLSSAAGSPLRTSAEVSSASEVDFDSLPNNIDLEPTEDDEDEVVLVVSDPVLIRGVKWHDENGNQQLDTDEPRLAGWTIFVDLNEDGILQSSEPSATTDADGRYEFRGLEPGSYVVREQPQDGWEQTFPGRLAAIDSPLVDALDDVVVPIDVAFADLDGSGPRDIVLLDLNRAILVSNADGIVQREELPLGRSGAFRVADVDDDGDDDVVLADADSGNLTVLQFADGVRSDRTISIARDGQVDIGVGPLGSDAGFDLYSLNARDFTATTYTSVGELTYETATFSVGRNPIAAQAGRLGPDDVGDLVVANYGDNTLSILHNPAAGGTVETISVGAGPAAVTVADLNNDGLDDVAVANSNDHTLSILVNSDQGLSTVGIVNLPEGARPQAISAADLNHDGFMDLLVANTETGSVSLLLNARDATFKRVDYDVAVNPLGFDLAETQMVIGGMDLSDGDVRSRVLLLDLNVGGHVVEVGTAAGLDHNFGNLCFANCSQSSNGTSSTSFGGHADQNVLSTAHAHQALMVPATPLGEATLASKGVAPAGDRSTATDRLNQAFTPADEGTASTTTSPSLTNTSVAQKTLERRDDVSSSGQDELSVVRSHDAALAAFLATAELLVDATVDSDDETDAMQTDLAELVASIVAGPLPV